MGHRLQQFLPFGRIIDLGEFLRQIQVIPADDAILDEPFAGFGHLLVFLLRLQEFTWIADRDRAREGVDMLDGAEPSRGDCGRSPRASSFGLDVGAARDPNHPSSGWLRSDLDTVKTRHKVQRQSLPHAPWSPS